MGYEAEKEMGIQRALVADLELKNRSLRETCEASTRKMSGLEERATISESILETQLKNRNADVAEACKQLAEMALKKMDLEEKLKNQQETYDVYISDIQGKLDSQIDVFNGVVAENVLLTEENERKRDEVKALKEQVKALRHRARVTEKLEKVLATFE